MPELDRARRAAEEINALIKAALIESVHVWAKENEAELDGFEMTIEVPGTNIEHLAAIILRHCDAERVLMEAAKWAVGGNDGECPGSMHEKCPDPDFEPCPMACSRDEKERCWLEYWRKEAEGVGEIKIFPTLSTSRHFMWNSEKN